MRASLELLFTRIGRMGGSAADLASPRPGEGKKLRIRTEKQPKA